MVKNIFKKLRGNARAILVAADALGACLGTATRGLVMAVAVDYLARLVVFEILAAQTRPEPRSVRPYVRRLGAGIAVLAIPDRVHRQML